MRWLLLAAGCGGASILGLAVGFYTTFPSAEMSDFAEFKFHEANKDYALELGDVRPWWLPGVRATDVTIYTVKRGKRTKDEPKPGMVRTEMVKLDSLAVRLQLLPRLAGEWSFGYAATLMGGEVDGSFSQGESSLGLDFTASDLDLSRMPIEKDDILVHLAGTLSGTSDLALDGEDVKNSTGAIELVFDGLQLAEGSKVMGLALPVVTFTAAKVRLEAKEGKLEVTEGTFDGDVLDMTLSGDVSLNKKLLRSRNRLELTVTLPEDLDRLAKLAPQMKRARDAEGGYHFNIGGTILSPTFRPGRGVGSKLAQDDGGEPTLPRFDGGAEKIGSAGMDEGLDPDEAREERRKRREERIKERRDRLKKRREDQSVVQQGEGADEGGGEEDGPMMNPRGQGEDEERPMQEEGGPEYDNGAGPNQREMPDMGPPAGEFGGENEE